MKCEVICQRCIQQMFQKGPKIKQNIYRRLAQRTNYIDAILTSTWKLDHLAAFSFFSFLFFSFLLIFSAIRQPGSHFFTLFFSSYFPLEATRNLGSHFFLIYFPRLIGNITTTNIPTANKGEPIRNTDLHPLFVPQSISTALL